MASVALDSALGLTVWLNYGWLFALTCEFFCPDVGSENQRDASYEGQKIFGQIIIRRFVVVMETVVRGVIDREKMKPVEDIGE